MTVLDKILAELEGISKQLKGDSKALLTTAEAAIFLSLHKDVLLRMAAKGKVPYRLISQNSGKRANYRFLKKDLEKFVERLPGKDCEAIK